MSYKPENLSKRAAKGAAWGLISNVTVSAISFLSTAILARLLEPKDFGLFGMAMIVTGVVRLFGDFGLSAALVHKKEIDNEYLSTAFWINVAAGLALAVVSIIVAPFASMFFKQPEVKWILIWFSGTFILAGLSSVHKTLLYREIRMKHIAIIEIGCRIARVIVILITAFLGFRFWSILIGVIVEGVLKTIAVIVSVNWRPNFIFCKKKFHELFHFGRNLYLQSFLSYFTQNMDFIITGKLLGAQMLGFYQFSYNLPHLVKSYMQDSVGPVAFPVFCKVQDDNERLMRGFLKAVKCISIITFPLMAGLFVCADDFIVVVYSSKWLLSVEPLKILCLSAALASVHTIMPSIFNSQGRPDIGLKWNLVKLPLTVVAIVIGGHINGILGIAYAMFTIEVLSVAMPFIAVRLIKQKFRTYVLALLPSIISSTVMVFLILLFRAFIALPPGMNILRLALEFLVGVSTYSLIIIIVFKKDFEELMNFGAHIIKR
ncbi:MAG: MOP flippase family protein [Candidatus Omnitrophica bacterium]|nr:MOP flippase family protein [Candidatus Omnitrophota bacterium]